MKYLFIHPVFPGQFHQVMATLAARPGNEVRHISKRSSMESVPGVIKHRYALPESLKPTGHPFVHKLETAVHEGLAVMKLLTDLRQKGFTPDLIYSYAGWGQPLFLKDLFPNVPLVGYFEWFLNAYGSEYNFDPEYPLGMEQQLYLRTSNSAALLDLQACDYGITPTRWQQHQFPPGLRNKLKVLHDGVDTDFYSPVPDPGLSLPDKGIGLPPGTPLVTYATRGMEPFRGFPQFMRALARLQQRCPDAHAVIVGSDEVHYSKLPEGANSYKELLLRELQSKLDLSRVHFTGWLDLPDYRKVLRASSAHVYLTRPYVLSWSLMESMAAGCLVIGSRTAPVEEMIRHGENGLLTDFFDPVELADHLEAALRDPERFRPLRGQARQTILDGYARDRLVPEHARLLANWAATPLRSDGRY